MKDKITEIQGIIGYKFNNKELLTRAFTHSSYSNENGGKSYQNMEFLGDSILDFIVAEHLIKLYPDADEGFLSKLRSNVVSKDPLADIVDSLNLDDYILTGGYNNLSRKTRSDIFESIIAAIYMDGGLEKAREFIIRFLGGLMKGKRVDNDYKSKLYELAAKRNYSLEFIHKDTTGPQHRPLFTYEVIINGEVCGKGMEHSKKAAQQEAARQALKNIYTSTVRRG
ncbi:MAG: ribonuclease III [Christensenellales bacterium]|jgi:ribonuclease-3